MVSPFSSSVSSPPLSLLSSSSSLSLFPSKHRPCRNPNHVLFSSSQTQSLEPLTLNQNSTFTSELFSDSSSSSSSSITNLVDYDLVDLFETLRVSLRLGDVELAEAVHGCVVKLGDDVRFGNALISAYLKLGFVIEAHRVFLGIPRPDLVAFTAMISGFSKTCREVEAIELFMKMRSEFGIEPNEFGFVAILTACIRGLEFQFGFQVHALVNKTGFLGCVFVVNALMSLYSKCGRFELVEKMFDEMPQRDLASWNIAISSAVKEGLYVKALELFRSMRGSEFSFGVDNFTISTILSACEFEQGREVHALAIKCGLEGNLSVGNSLIGFYRKLGGVEDLEALYEEMLVRDVITWTEMITAYMDFGLIESALEMFETMPERNAYSYNSLLAGFCKNGQGLKALEIFVDMISECLELTDFTLSSVVSACSLLGEAKISQQVHGFVIKSGCDSNAFVESALLDMYTRCGRMSDADKMFDQHPSDRDKSVILTSKICGYARNGQLKDAISLFRDSHSNGNMVLDEIALTSVLGICGSLAFQEMGKQIHSLSLKSGFSMDLEVANSTVTMYAKSWNIKDAIKTFHSMDKRDVVSWNCLIAGHILHKRGDDALLLWSEMQKTSIKPNSVTFTLVLLAYKYTEANLVDQCRTFFHSLKTNFNAEPTSEHIASFVRVLGFWGLLEEAEETVEKLPFEPEMNVWRALLNTSRIRGNTRVGKRITKRILATEPRDESSYVLVSNLYSASGRWHCSENVREEMREKGLKKQPGQSWIVHENKVHSFYARDKSHEETKDIYSGLEILIRECLRSGYVPDTSFVLHEVEEYQKESFLFYHSAKLAAAYGVLIGEPGKPIRIVKNIALCGDCHEFLKSVSGVTGREICLRDTSGFHWFSGGECSCKDYW